jgi:U4/U6 small nuclear ribonucleoprotein PRP3
MKHYKRLMLRRIVWTEAARSVGDNDEELDEDDEQEMAEVNKGKGKEVVAGGATVSLEDNRCDLVWEGEIADRTFRSFRTRPCPTDALAKEALGSKLAGYWDLAKHWKPQEDELF